MEVQKIDKRTKEYKESIQNSEIRNVTYSEAMESTPIQKLIAASIPLTKAEFHASVNNSDNVPETYFSETSGNANRRVTMWLMSNGCLLCFQKGKYFSVGAATWKYVNFK